MNTDNNETFPFVTNPFLTWTKMIDESQGHFDGIYDEWERRQKEAIAQVNEAMNESVKLAQSSLGFSSEVSQEWLKLARNATRWAGDLTKTVE